MHYLIVYFFNRELTALLRGLHCKINGIEQRGWLAEHSTLLEELNNLNKKMRDFWMDARYNNRSVQSLLYDVKKAHHELDFLKEIEVELSRRSK